MEVEQRSVDHADAALERMYAPPSVVSPIWGWLLGLGTLGAGVVASVLVGRAMTWESGVMAWWIFVAFTPVVEYLLERLRGVPHPRAHWVRRGAICALAGALGILSILIEQQALRLGLAVIATLVFMPALWTFPAPAAEPEP
jgi:hypothetical protein